MKIAKSVAIFLTTLFAGIVLIERVPGVLIDTSVPHEWLMFGLFKISLIDDITHGLSAILGIIALLMGSKWTIKYLMLIGGYYFLDATFSLIDGVWEGQSFAYNFMLNAPHVGISILVFIALFKAVERVTLTSE